MITRPKPAYGRQGLDWIVGPGYSFLLYLRPLGKVIIFRDRQTDKQNLPIIYRLLLMLILPLSSPIGENVSLLGPPSSVQCYARDNRGWTTFDDDHHLAFNR